MLSFSSWVTVTMAGNLFGITKYAAPNGEMETAVFCIKFEIMPEIRISLRDISKYQPELFVIASQSNAE